MQSGTKKRANEKSIKLSGANDSTGGETMQYSIAQQIKDYPWTVYVGNLCKKMSWVDVYTEFSKYGSVWQCEHHVENRRSSSAYAVVSYQDYESAYKAAKLCNGKYYHGHRVFVATTFESWWPILSSRKLYVTNFSVFVDELVLWRVFGKKAPTEIKIRWNVFGYRYALITFPSELVTQEVLTEFNGMDLGDGYKMKLSHFHDSDNGRPISLQQFRAEQCMRESDRYVRISNFSQLLNEKDLHGLFRPFGFISDLVILRAFNRSIGYGAIRFASKECAVRAVREMNGVENNNLLLKVQLLDDVKLSDDWAYPIEPTLPPIDITSSSDESGTEEPILRYPTAEEIVVDVFDDCGYEALIECLQGSEQSSEAPAPRPAKNYPVHTAHYIVRPAPSDAPSTSKFVPLSKGAPPKPVRKVGPSSQPVAQSASQSANPENLLQFGPQVIKTRVGPRLH